MTDKPGIYNLTVCNLPNGKYKVEERAMDGKLVKFFIGGPNSGRNRKDAHALGASEGVD